LLIDLQVRLLVCYSGNSKMNLVPLLASLSNITVPSMVSINRLITAKPKPRPLVPAKRRSCIDSILEGAIEKNRGRDTPKTA
jgi:hypothetical protein